MSFVDAQQTTIEGNTDHTVSVRVHLTRPLYQPVKVTLGIGGTAQPGVDFTAPDHAVIPKLTTDLSIPVLIKADTAVEPTETVVLSIISATNVAIGEPKAASIAITDDDATQPAIDISAASICIATQQFHLAWVVPAAPAFTSFDVSLGVSGAPTDIVHAHVPATDRSWEVALPSPISNPQPNLVARVVGNTTAAPQQAIGLVGFSCPGTPS